MSTFKERYYSRYFPFIRKGSKSNGLIKMYVKESANLRIFFLIVSIVLGGRLKAARPSSL